MVRNFWAISWVSGLMLKIAMSASAPMPRWPLLGRPRALAVPARVMMAISYRVSSRSMEGRRLFLRALLWHFFRVASRAFLL